MPKWSAMQWLPKTHNFPFVGLLADGSTRNCRVKRDIAGNYTITGAEPQELRGWKC